MSSIIEEHLEEEGLSIDDLKRLWLHQANLGMNTLISKRLLGRDPTKLEMNSSLEYFPLIF